MTLQIPKGYHRRMADRKRDRARYLLSRAKKANQAPYKVRSYRQKQLEDTILEKDTMLIIENRTLREENHLLEEHRLVQSHKISELTLEKSELLLANSDLKARNTILIASLIFLAVGSISIILLLIGG